MQDSPQQIQFAFYDSGTGGLPYMRYLKQLYPDSRCMYVADTRNFPYGEKTSAQIIDCSLATADLIIRRFNPEAIVVACNTISVTALEQLRSSFSVPFIGTVPAIKLAASISKNKRIGLWATKRTIFEKYTQNLIDDFAVDCEVFKRVDSELVSYIERHLFTSGSAERMAACRPSVEYFLSQQVDTIVLACTHFIHIKAETQRLVGPDVCIVDSRDGVIRQAMRIINGQHLACPLHLDALAPVPTGSLGLRGAKKQDAFLASIPDSALFVTAFRSKDDEGAYMTWCDYFKIPFMGLID